MDEKGMDERKERRINSIKDDLITPKIWIGVSKEKHGAFHC